MPSISCLRTVSQGSKGTFAILSGDPNLSTSENPMKKRLVIEKSDEQNGESAPRKVLKPCGWLKPHGVAWNLPFGFVLFRSWTPPPKICPKVPKDIWVCLV